jgi:hypothetical protein
MNITYQASKPSRAMCKGREHLPQSSSTTLQIATIDSQAPNSSFDQNMRTTHGVCRCPLNTFEQNPIRQQIIFVARSPLHVEPTSGAA